MWGWPNENIKVISNILYENNMERNIGSMAPDEWSSEKAIQAINRRGIDTTTCTTVIVFVVDFC